MAAGEYEGDFNPSFEGNVGTMEPDEGYAGDDDLGSLDFPNDEPSADLEARDLVAYAEQLEASPTTLSENEPTAETAPDLYENSNLNEHHAETPDTLGETNPDSKQISLEDLNDFEREAYHSMVMEGKTECRIRYEDMDQESKEAWLVLEIIQNETEEDQLSREIRLAEPTPENGEFKAEVRKTDSGYERRKELGKDEWIPYEQGMEGEWLEAYQAMVMNGGSSFEVRDPGTDSEGLEGYIRVSFTDTEATSVPAPRPIKHQLENTSTDDDGGSDNTPITPKHPEGPLDAAPHSPDTSHNGSQEPEKPADTAPKKKPPTTQAKKPSPEASILPIVEEPLIPPAPDTPPILPEPEPLNKVIEAQPAPESQKSESPEEPEPERKSEETKPAEHPAPAAEITPPAIPEVQSHRAAEAPKEQADAVTREAHAEPTTPDIPGGGAQEHAPAQADTLEPGQTANLHEQSEPASEDVIPEVSESSEVTEAEAPAIEGAEAIIETTSEVPEVAETSPAETAEQEAPPIVADAEEATIIEEIAEETVVEAQEAPILEEIQDRAPEAAIENDAEASTIAEVQTPAIAEAQPEPAVQAEMQTEMAVQLENTHEETEQIITYEAAETAEDETEEVAEETAPTQVVAAPTTTVATSWMADFGATHEAPATEDNWRMSVDAEEAVQAEAPAATTQARRTAPAHAARTESFTRPTLSFAPASTIIATTSVANDDFADLEITFDNTDSPRRTPPRTQKQTRTATV